jgi:hypothetical protein
MNDETLPNLINEQTLIRKGKKRNKKREPMPNVQPRDGTQKCKQINGHKRNQQGLVKEGSNEN